MQQVTCAPGTLNQENVTLIAQLTIIGAQEAEFYSGQDDIQKPKPKE
jgi:hypothetical protein